MGGLGRQCSSVGLRSSSRGGSRQEVSRGRGSGGGSDESGGGSWGNGGGQGERRGLSANTVTVQKVSHWSCTTIKGCGLGKGCGKVVTELSDTIQYEHTWTNRMGFPSRTDDTSWLSPSTLLRV